MVGDNNSQQQCSGFKYGESNLTRLAVVRQRVHGILPEKEIPWVVTAIAY